MYKSILAICEGGPDVVMSFRLAAPVAARWLLCSMRRWTRALSRRVCGRALLDCTTARDGGLPVMRAHGLAYFLGLDSGHGQGYCGLSGAAPAGSLRGSGRLHKLRTRVLNLCIRPR